MTPRGAVIDTSAIAAIVFGEPDAERYADVLIRNVGVCVMGAPTLVETVLVARARFGELGGDLVQAVLERAAVRIEPFGEELAGVAVAAWVRFGKGRHPAQLNLGDCYSYALSKQLDLPLLFKGNDFSQTDVQTALD